MSELFLFAAEGVNFTRSTTRITGEHPVAPKGDEGKLQIVITLLQCTGKLHTIITLLQYTGICYRLFLQYYSVQVSYRLLLQYYILQDNDDFLIVTLWAFSHNLASNSYDVTSSYTCFS